MNILFFANLGDDNATELTQEIGEREAVLLSAPGAARRTLDAAHAIQARQIPVAADNANTAVIFQIAKEFVVRAVALYREREQETSKPSKARLLAVTQFSEKLALEPTERFAERGLEAADLFQKQLQETAGSGKFAALGVAEPTPKRALQAAPKAVRLSVPLRAKYRALAKDVARRCGDFVLDARQKQVLAAQASVKPTFFTCLEDLTVPILVQLDVEPEYTGMSRSAFVKLQKRGLKVASDVIQGRLGTVEGIPYATLHAFDYDSAFQVGVQAATVKGLEGIATGLASFLNDRNYINSYILRGRRVWVKGRKNVPQRYIRLLLVTLGLCDGFASKRGVLPRFHGLGAGAPIAMPLLALCGYGSPLLTIDSTAPEKNASIGKLFVSKPAPLTVSVERVAQAIVEGRQTWDCSCSYCTALQRELPFDIESAREYYRANIAPREIEPKDLETDNGIGRYLSILWETRTQPAKRSIYHARVNHSQWAIVEIEPGLREHSGSYAELRSWVGALCEAYKATAAPTFALQIDECLRLIDRLRPMTKGVKVRRV